MTDIKTLIIEAADRRDLTYAENFNGRAYALMDAQWVGYYDTLDEVIEFLDISEARNEVEEREEGEVKLKDIAIKKIKGFSSAYPNICNLKLLLNTDGTWVTIQDDVGTSMTIKLSDISDFIKRGSENEVD